MTLAEVPLLSYFSRLVSGQRLPCVCPLAASPLWPTLALFLVERMCLFLGECHARLSEGHHPLGGPTFPTDPSVHYPMHTPSPQCLKKGAPSPGLAFLLALRAAHGVAAAGGMTGALSFGWDHPSVLPDEVLLSCMERMARGGHWPSCCKARQSHCDGRPRPGLPTP